MEQVSPGSSDCRVWRLLSVMSPVFYVQMGAVTLPSQGHRLAWRILVIAGEVPKTVPDLWRPQDKWGYFLSPFMVLQGL